MNTALIFAGGTGQRMNARAKPKQFLELHGKPVILYTLEHFEYHPEIDSIIVVCLEGWIDELTVLLRRYEMKKIIQIVSGGATAHESIFKGLEALESICGKDDIVLIHDGVRPLISEELISANIAAVKERGNAITVAPATESMVVSSNGTRVDSVPERETMYIAKAPQSFRYGLIWDMYKKARQHGQVTVDSAQLLSLYGVEMFMVKGPANNIKITAPADYYIFRALYEAMENQQILGI